MSNTKWLILFHIEVYESWLVYSCSNNGKCSFIQGLSKDKEKRDNVKNSFWVYNINKNRW